MGNILSFVFALVYVFLNYHLYKRLIYPMLIKNYCRGYLWVMTLVGWLLVIGLWLVYLATFLVVAKTGGDKDVSIIFLKISGCSLILTMVATSWPKPIGSFLLRK